MNHSGLGVGGGIKTLVVRPLKKKLFLYVRLPLDRECTVYTITRKIMMKREE